MICPVNNENFYSFKKACKYERVFGTKILSSALAYGFDRLDSSCWVDISNNVPTTAMFVRDGVCIVSSNNNICLKEFVKFIKQNNIHEIDTNLQQCGNLLNIMGGKTESSYYMEYNGGKIDRDFSLLTENSNLEDVFSILQQSHEYYKTHHKYNIWAEDLQIRLSKGLCTVYQLNIDDKPIGTGMIASEDKDTCAIAAIAVLPEYRGQKWGTYISSAIVNHIIAKNKKPILISGYNEVAALYEKIGFSKLSKWGTLYI